MKTIFNPSGSDRWKGGAARETLLAPSGIHQLQLSALTYYYSMYNVRYSDPFCAEAWDLPCTSMPLLPCQRVNDRALSLRP